MIRKKCKRCGEKVNNKYRFCPNCGALIKKTNQKAWGMLGKDDFKEKDPLSPSALDNITGSLFNKMLGGAMKMLEKEMKKEIARENRQPKTNVKLMINGKEINLKDAKKQSKNTEEKQELLDSLPKADLKKFSKLPKKEPKTNIKRLSNIVIYEINMPGIKSIKNLSIIKLENSIEIKAVTKNKAYFKSIPVNLPILNYELEKGKLILELEPKN